MCLFAHFLCKFINFCDFRNESERAPRYEFNERRSFNWIFNLNNPIDMSQAPSTKTGAKMKRPTQLKQEDAESFERKNHNARE